MGETSFIIQTEDMALNKIKKLHEQKERELIAENKKFLAIIGHDIKTPMSSVIGFLNLIKDGIYEWDKDKIEEKIDIALIAANRTYYLLNNLLEWSIAGNLVNSFHPEYLDLNEVLKDETKNIELFASQKRIIIKPRFFFNEKVFADKNMVKIIIRNLLNNAIKYSHQYGKIEIFTKRIKGFIEITIKDFGIGINDRKLGTIFSSDNFASTLGTSNEPGTGIGLLLCKEFIDIHNGKIWIISKLGEGSEIKFTLPVSLH